MGDRCCSFAKRNMYWLQAVAAAVAEGAALRIAMAAGRAQAGLVVFHQLQVGAAYGANIAAHNFVPKFLANGKHAGAAGAGGKILYPKFEQRDEKEMKIAIGTSNVQPRLAAAQGADSSNLSGRFCTVANTHNAKEKHILSPPLE